MGKMGPEISSEEAVRQRGRDIDGEMVLDTEIQI